GSSSRSSPGSASAGRKTRSPPSCQQRRSHIRGSRPHRKERVVSETALLTEEPTALAVRTQKRYGWRPDHPDMRDYLMAVAPVKTLPAEVRLRDQMTHVYDKG